MFIQRYTAYQVSYINFIQKHINLVPKQIQIYMPLRGLNYGISGKVTAANATGHHN